MKSRSTAMALSLGVAFTLMGCAAGSAASRADRYATTVEATRAPEGAVKVNVKVVRPGDWKTTTVAAPAFLLMEGARAQAMVGSGGPNGKPELYDGVKVVVDSAKEKDEVTVVSSVVDHGAVVWTDSRTVKVTAGAGEPAAVK